MKKHLNKKLKRASKSYHIEQLEPRLMMDFAV